MIFPTKIRRLRVLRRLTPFDRFQIFGHLCTIFFIINVFLQSRIKLSTKTQSVSHNFLWGRNRNKYNGQTGGYRASDERQMTPRPVLFGCLLMRRPRKQNRPRKRNLQLFFEVGPKPMQNVKETLLEKQGSYPRAWLRIFREKKKKIELYYYYKTQNFFLFYRKIQGVPISTTF